MEKSEHMTCTDTARSGKIPNRKIKEAKLKTLNMIYGLVRDDVDYHLWKKIYGYMDGETAMVIESAMNNGQYVLLGLKDEEKNRELYYMIEQDSMIGMYIDDREAFDQDWDSGVYEPDGCLHLEPEDVEILESGGLREAD